MARRFLIDNSSVAHAEMPMSREEAAVLSVRFYFSGKPCRWHKHVAPRYTCAGRCVACFALQARKSADKDRAAFRRKSREKYAANRAKVLASARDRYAANIIEERAKGLAYYYKNHEREKERRRESRLRNIDKDRENRRRSRERRRAKIAEYNRQYKAANRHIYAAAQKARETRLSLAMPPWADLEAIKAVYAEARRLTITTGIKHEVDHIVPLQGRNVCGLHVHWNLQVLPKRDNVRKSNRLIEELICESASLVGVGTVPISVSP